MKISNSYSCTFTNSGKYMYWLYEEKVVVQNVIVFNEELVITYAYIEEDN